MNITFKSALNDNGFAIVSQNGEWFASTPTDSVVEIRAVSPDMPLKSCLDNFSQMEKCGSNNTVLGANGNILAFASGTQISLFKTEENTAAPIKIDIPEAFTSATMQLGIFNNEEHIWFLIDSGPYAGLVVYDLDGNRIAHTDLMHTGLETTAYNTGPTEITVIYNNRGNCAGVEKIVLTGNTLNHQVLSADGSHYPALRIDGIVSETGTLFLFDDDNILYEINKDDWTTRNRVGLPELDTDIVTRAGIATSDFLESDMIDTAPHKDNILLLLADDNNNCQYFCRLHRKEPAGSLELAALEIIDESWNIRPRRLLAHGVIQCISGRDIFFSQ